MKYQKYAVLLTGMLCSVFLTSCFWSTPEYEKASYPELTAKDEALFKALRFPRSNSAEQALANGANPNARDDSGLTPLHLAIRNGNLAFTGMLLKAGANPNAQSRTGYSPLHAAAALTDPAIVELLLNKGAKVDIRNSHAWTPLMEAARFGKIKVVKFLIEHGASLSARDSQERTPLMFACTASENSLEMAEYMLSKGAGLNDIDEEGRTASIWAIVSGNSKTALNLLDRLGEYKKGEDFAILGLITMKYAIYSDDQEVVKKLIAKGLPLNSDITLAFKTTKIFNVDGIHKLFARNSIIDDGKTPLIWAAEKDNVDIIRILLDAGANPHQKDNAGNTADRYARDRTAVRILEKAMKI